MSVADDIGVTKDLMLEFNAVRVSRRRGPSADVQDKLLAFAKNHFVLGPEWIALAFGGNNLHRLGQKDGSLIAHLKRGRAIFAC
jgi:hypothetical protein